LIAVYADLVVMHLADWWWLITPAVLLTLLTGLWLWLAKPIDDERTPVDIDD